MEFMTGDKITDILSQEKSDERKEIVLYRLVDCFAEQVLEYGVFQADAHPGNLLVTEKNEIIILDFGLIKYLTDKQKEGFIQLGSAIVKKDETAMKKSFQKLGFMTQSGDLTIFKYFGNIFMSIFTGMHMDEVKSQYQRLITLLQNEKIAGLPHFFILLVRVFITLNGLQSIYSPKADFSAVFLKHKKRLDTDLERHIELFIQKALAFLEMPEILETHKDNTEKWLGNISHLLSNTEKKRKSDKLYYFAFMLTFFFFVAGLQLHNNQLFFTLSGIFGFISFLLLLKK